MFQLAAIIGGLMLSAAAWRSGGAQTRGADVIELTPDAGQAGIFAALARVKELRQTGRKHGRIELHFGKGEYRLLSPIVIDEEDSASEEDGIVLQGGPGVRITGTIRVGAFRPTDHPHVFVAPVQQLGNLAGSEFVSFGYANPPSTMPPEAFADSRRLNLPRWSDDPATVSSVEETANGWTLKLRLNGLRPTAVSGHAFALIRWNGDWDYSYEPVTAVTTDPVSITIPKREKVVVAGLTTAMVFNPGMSLSRSGDYFLDWSNGQIYVWSPAVPTAPVEISIAEHLLVIQRATNVVVTEMAWDGSRSDAILVVDGTGIRLSKVTVRNAATNAVSLDGHDNEISDSTMEDVGAAGVNLFGGDRRTLQAGHNRLLRSSIRRFGLTMPSYRPGIALFGVGNTVEGNVISDGPHAGLIVHGNNHVVVGNVFRHLVESTDDGGALYMGRDWTERGTVIRDNIFQDIHGRHDRSIAVYLDDQESGIHVEGNHFSDVSVGVLVGGGVDNEITNNLMANTRVCIRADHRGMDWQRKDVVSPRSDLRLHLGAVPYATAPYAQQYPTLVTILQDEPGVPKRNVIAGNRCDRGVFDLPAGFGSSNTVN